MQVKIVTNIKTLLYYYLDLNKILEVEVVDMWITSAKKKLRARSLSTFLKSSLFKIMLITLGGFSNAARS